MFIPLTGFVLFILSLGVILSPSEFLPLPGIGAVKKDRILIGATLSFCGILMLGGIGYIGLVSAPILKAVRGGLLLVTLITVLLHSPTITGLHQRSFLRWLNTSKVLSGVAIYILGCLFIRCLIQIDGNGDTWMYQLPFAARMWGLVTPENYVMDSDRELLYISFPKLANFFQGMFWKMAGLENPQVANLVSFLSLAALITFARYALQIPFYLSSIALLAVPLIHIAATASYVDLFGNVGVTVVILCTYLLWLDYRFLKTTNIVIFVIAGTVAANTKFLLVPIVGLFFLLALMRIIYIQFAWYIAPQRRRNLRLLLLGTPIAGAIIFATEVINVIRYQNPFYPLKVSILGFVLNYASVPSSDYMSSYLQSMSALQRWVYSLLEIGAFDGRRPWPWAIAMDFVPIDSDSFGVGGYFSIYVIFNIMILALLCCQRSKAARYAGILFIALSLITLVMPFAYQLRYYMYWMMTLVLLNLYLLQQINYAGRFPLISSLLTPRNFGLVATAVLFLFITLTRWDFTYPRSNYLVDYLKYNTKPEILQKLEINKNYCLVDFSPHSFLYNSVFYPPKNYSIKSEFNISPEYVQENCQGRIILFPPGTSS
jgi:hypothetical protein